MVHYVVIVYFTTISFEAWSRGKGGKGAPSNGHVVPKAAAAAAGTGQVVPPRSRRLKTRLLRGRLGWGVGGSVLRFGGFGLGVGGVCGGFGAFGADWRFGIELLAGFRVRRALKLPTLVLLWLRLGFL